jgi:hypothetical protein
MSERASPPACCTASATSPWATDSTSPPAAIVYGCPGTTAARTAASICCCSGAVAIGCICRHPPAAHASATQAMASMPTVEPVRGRSGARDTTAGATASSTSADTLASAPTDGAKRYGNSGGANPTATVIHTATTIAGAIAERDTGRPAPAA